MTDWRPFWDSVHSEGKGYWLTDTPGVEALTQLESLELCSPPPRTVMEIGIGRHYLTGYLDKAGHKITAVDISERAFRGLPDRIARVRTPDMVTLPDLSHDIGLSFLMFQHADDEMAGFILKQAVRTCSKFRFQFGSPVAGVPFVNNTGGPLYLRTPAEMAGLCPDAKLRLMSGPVLKIPDIAWCFMEASL